MCHETTAVSQLRYIDAHHAQSGGARPGALLRRAFRHRAGVRAADIAICRGALR
jgi:hypothetical protein